MWSSFLLTRASWWPGRCWRRRRQTPTLWAFPAARPARRSECWRALVRNHRPSCAMALSGACRPPYRHPQPDVRAEGRGCDRAGNADGGRRPRNVVTQSGPATRRLGALSDLAPGICGGLPAHHPPHVVRGAPSQVSLSLVRRGLRSRKPSASPVRSDASASGSAMSAGSGLKASPLGSRSGSSTVM